MGADARLFIFDFNVYRNQVAPAFSRLMLSGEMEPWLLQLLQSHAEEVSFKLETIPSTGFVPVDFSESCTHLDAEFAVRNISHNSKAAYNGSWEARACRSLECHLRLACPFHWQQGEQLNLMADEWILWLQLAIRERCLGSGIFLGRSVDRFFYWDLLDELGLPNEHLIRNLLECLGGRGSIIGYQGTSGTEGIHGWLSPAETKILADELFGVPLPEYEYSFAGMESFRQRRNILAGRVEGIQFQGLTYEHPSASFEELSLSFVRTLAWLAARDGKGILWGNDFA